MKRLLTLREELSRCDGRWLRRRLNHNRARSRHGDRWYRYIARPRTSRWPSWFERRVKQTGVLRRFTDRLPMKTRSKSSREHPTTPSGPPPQSGGHGHTGD